MWARARAAAPVRSFGLLSALVLARKMNDEIQSRNKRIRKLEDRLEGQRQISKATAILMKTRNVNEGDAYNLIRHQAMASASTRPQIADPETNASEALDPMELARKSLAGHGRAAEFRRGPSTRCRIGRWKSSSNTWCRDPAAAHPVLQLRGRRRGGGPAAGNLPAQHRLHPRRLPRILRQRPGDRPAGARLLSGDPHPGAFLPGNRQPPVLRPPGRAGRLHDHGHPARPVPRLPARNRCACCCATTACRWRSASRTCPFPCTSPSRRASTSKASIPKSRAIPCATTSTCPTWR
ncbi:hypothetical protein CDEN61S_04000 [Castellaniella denitrificans]